MRIKSLALATTLSLLSTSALVGPVNAQKGVTLQPQSSWAVKRVNEDSPNGYCALARRFENGLILTLAKNDKHEISFAIDFPQGKFSAEQRYEISLDPGAGEQRKFKVKPAGSGKAFVVRVGSDQKFMSALLRTGYLRIVVENESYNFNLADIDQGQEQLEACLYAGMTPAAGGGSATSVPSYTQVADLRAEKDKLEARLKSLEKENEDLRLRKSSAVSNQDMRESPGSQSALKVTSSPAVDGLLRQIQSLKNENAELQKLADASKNNTPVSTDVSVVELARENQRLQTLLQEQESADSYKQQVRELTQRITSLENENIALAQQKHDGLAAGEKHDLERQILALKSENEALRNNLNAQSAANTNDYSDVKSTLSELEQENFALNARIARLMSEKSNVMEQLGYYEDENEKLRNVSSEADTSLLSQLRDEIRKIEGDNARLLAQKETEISALQSDLQKLKTEQARAVASTDDIQRQTEAVFKTQIEALSIKNEALKEELINLSRGQARLDELRNNVEATTQEKLALQDKLDNAHLKISELQSQIDTQQASKNKNEEDKVALRLQMDGLNADISSLKTKLSELTHMNETLQANLLERSNGDQELKAQIESYREELTALENANLALKAELQGMRDNGNEAAAKVASLLQQNEALRAQLKTYQGEQIDKVASLHESLNQLNAAKVKLQEQASADIAALEQSLKQANNANAAWREEAAKKVALLENTLENAYTANTQASEQKNAELAGLEQELLELRLELQSVQDDKMAALNKSEALQSLSDEVALKEQQLKGMRAELEQREASLDKRNIEVEEKSQSIHSLQESLSALENENKDLVLALNNANTFNEKLQKDWSETLASYQALQKENDGVVLASSEAEEKIAEARSQQGDKLVELQRKNKELTSQLEAQAREYLVLVRDMETLKQQQSAAQPQSVSIDTEEVNELRANNTILKGEVDILRQQLSRKELPEAREASLNQDEAVMAMHNEARRAREAQLAENQRQAQREEITKLAAVEPASGDETLASEDIRIAANRNVEQNEPIQSVADENIAIREVIDELEMDNAAGLSEAQKLERSLKTQIERSARSPDLQQRLPEGETSERLQPVEPVMRERLAAASEKTEPAPIQQRLVDNIFSPRVDVSELLAAANIDLAAPVSLVGNSSGSDRVAYQWRSANDLYGSAHQKQISNINEFDSYVRDYLSMTEERCTGDFAIIPSSTEQVGQTRIDSYEIACVGNGVNSSASVVFFNSDDTFTVLAHEGPTEGMEMAMDARDKIVSTVEKS